MHKAFEMRLVLKLGSLTLVILVVLALPPVIAQADEIRMNSVIRDVLKAEMAGATPNELSGLLDQLNGVLGLQDQLRSATSAEKKAQLQLTIDNQLATIDAEANQLSLVASQRTYMEHLTVYATALIGAVIAALASEYALSLNRRLKTRSTLEWKITARK